MYHEHMSSITNIMNSMTKLISSMIFPLDGENEIQH